MKWLVPNEEPIPFDVPILAEMEICHGVDAQVATCCSVDDQGWLWQLPVGCGTVGCFTRDDIQRYILLEDVTSAIEDEDE